MRLGDPKNWRTDRSELVNPASVSSVVQSELHFALERARAAGTEGPLEYVGAGMFGIVFCDAQGHAWKVSRRDPDVSKKHLLWLRESLEKEYEWLRDAAESPIAEHVVTVFSMNPEELVLEVECVPGRPGGWADESGLFQLHRKIEQGMIPLGWNAPEFKGDSYVIQPDGTPKLVDTSMVQRLGMNLAEFVDDVLQGRRQTSENWHSLAFYVLREMREKEIPEDVGKELLDRLVERDPEIARAFILPGKPKLSGRDEGGTVIDGKRFEALVDEDGKASIFDRQSSRRFHLNFKDALEIVDAAARALTAMEMGTREVESTPRFNISISSNLRYADIVRTDDPKKGFGLLSAEELEELRLITEDLLVIMLKMRGGDLR